VVAQQRHQVARGGVVASRGDARTPLVQSETTARGAIQCDEDRKRASRESREWDRVRREVGARGPVCERESRARALSREEVGGGVCLSPW